MKKKKKVERKEIYIGIGTDIDTQVAQPFHYAGRASHGSDKENFLSHRVIEGLHIRSQHSKGVECCF